MYSVDLILKNSFGCSKSLDIIIEMTSTKGEKLSTMMVIVLVQ